MIESLSLYLNLTELSRYEQDRSVLKVRIVPVPEVNPSGTVTIALVRQDGATVMAQDIPFGSGSFPKGSVLIFDLSALKDEDGFPLMTSGQYSVQASAANLAPVAAPFKVSLMTAASLKKNYCAGLPLKQTDVMAPVKQPQLVTGVTVSEVSPDSAPGTYFLSYKAASGGDPATLQWNDGAVVELPAVPGDEILPGEDGNYLTVQVDPFETPDADAAEGLVLDYATIDDATLQGHIASAVGELERYLGSFLEPKRVATSPYFEAPDPGKWFDRKAETGAFYRQDNFSQVSLSWRISLPHKNIEKISVLEGFFGGSKILQLSYGVFALNRKAGVVEVLPQAAELSYIITFFTQLNYWGQRDAITDFWRFQGVVGIPENNGPKDDILKAIGYEAAITVLAIAGQAARGGRVSESTSKDGVSRSTSSGGDGLYAAAAKEYKEWLATNRPRLRQKWGGFTMSTI